MASMNIGRLAEHAGVNVDTIRYYERKQLLPPPGRNASGYRQYDQSDLERLSFIRRSKELGFSLAEIRELLSLTDDTRTDMRIVKDKAEQRLAQVEEKMAELNRMKRGLKKLIEACPGQGRLQSCPIVAALNGSGRN